ncbi:MAG: right-handed parallel beta-helix repeat-containing protein, partial [Candidatus Helarchaeota archaeon]|nr:right-handed parallel beta-helix repeat-containing protein [Candidatus Helarchaeota archaeon]
SAGNRYNGPVGPELEEDCWHFVRIRGNMDTQTYWFQVWNAETNELLYEQRHIPFVEQCNHVKYLGLSTAGQHDDEMTWVDDISLSVSAVTVPDPIYIDDNADLTQFPGSGTEEDPYRIQNYEIDASGSDSALEIRNTNANLQILGCTVTGGGSLYGDDAGITLVNCANVKIIECTARENGLNGIYLESCTDIVLGLNTIENNLYGISLESTSNSFLGTSSISNNEIGIQLSLSNTNILSENTVKGNSNCGIFVHHSNDNDLLMNAIENHWNIGGFGSGIDIAYSDNNLISENTLSNNYDGIAIEHSTINNLVGNIVINGYRGVILSDSDVNIIERNEMSNNWLGLYICDGSDSNRIFKNAFLNNLFANAFADNSGNIWSDGGVGNYWSDYRTRYPNANLIDGIWNEPYLIPGLSAETDSSPLVLPVDLLLTIEPDYHPESSDDVTIDAILTTKGGTPLQEQWIHFNIASESLPSEYIGSAKTDQSGRASLKWTCDKPQGDYTLSAELQYPLQIQQHFNDLENYEEFENYAISHYYWFDGYDYDNANGIMGMRADTTDYAWQGEHALKTWDYIPEEYSNTHGAEANHYYVMDATEYCYDQFEMSAYIYHTPSNLPPLGVFDSGVWFSPAQTIGVKMGEGDTMSIYAAMIAQAIDRATGNHIWVYNDGQDYVQEQAGVVIPGLSWMENHWYFVRVGGDVRYKQYWFEIWDATTNELLYKKANLDFIAPQIGIDENGDPIYAIAEYIRLFGFATSGRDGNTAYYDNFRVQRIVYTSGISQTSPFTIYSEDEVATFLELEGSATFDTQTATWHYEIEATLTTDSTHLFGKEIYFFLFEKDLIPFLEQLGSSFTQTDGIATFSIDLFDGPTSGLTLKVLAEFRGDNHFDSSISPQIEPDWAGSMAQMSIDSPNLDLHVYDDQGRHVGMNYEVNQTEIEIPGAYYSGDVRFGTEWIYIPPDVINYYVIVDGRNAEFPIESYNLTITTMTIQNLTAQVSYIETIQAGDTAVWTTQISPDTGELEVQSLNVSIIQKLEYLTVTILQLNNTAFDENPDQRKATLSDKIQDILDLVEATNYSELYDSILHDLKPKLTGLKTNENEIPWANGIFNNPWVIDPVAQELLRIQCNQILSELKLKM